MRIFAGLAIAASLASSAAAAASGSAKVYLLRPQATVSTDSIERTESSDSTTTASTTSSVAGLPQQIVRQILLQRLRVDDDAATFLNTLPEGYDADTALNLLEHYGVATTPLFEPLSASGGAGRGGRRPHQLMVIVEGVTPEHVQRLESPGLLGAYSEPSFAVADPPSRAAIELLFVGKLGNTGISVQRKRLDVSDLLASQTDGSPFVGVYDVQKNPDIIDDLVTSIPQILSAVESGDAEAILVLLPSTSRSSKLNSWTTKAVGPKQPKKAEMDGHGELRKRLHARAAESEAVIGEVEEPGAQETANSNDVDGEAPQPIFEAVHAPAPIVASAATPIPACFQSFNSCVALTANCSSHGVCVDKYALNSGTSTADKRSFGIRADSDPACFVCHCFSTLNRPETSPGGLSTTHWAGSMCQKKDVSVPFWLITGFTVTLVGSISFAIGLLFQVGEEKLPGVIGAGVSRSR
ncbi:hypothetical protein SPI_04427 [Niveomyces insectorum RCEF 264]|uniref:Vacuolar sorting protein Vps3844 C-terminal domain-containing protein n=1 Tax=Niveomyces insectorum RCEF 264 TaxID=1081102 RepID=A0A167VQP4_9HYPO|nr:hypothetical protein SPI_04427 [Niveomyces insectorum RCEF 264]